jgi:N-acetylmuramic acid 6-phosphate etherase
LKDVDNEEMNQENALPKIGELLTEARNAASENLDMLSTAELLQVINDADKGVALAVERELANIAAAVDLIVEQMNAGGRLFYVGAGTSGRLGVLDASECPPTFSVPATLVVGIIAGGDSALRRSAEQAEDDPGQGAADLKARSFEQKDVLVGIAASGRTPYVLGAIDYARSINAVTIGLSCVPNSELARAAQVAISPAVGPEVLTGSTRMKAGTATKMVLNMITTGAMVKMGAVYGNLMVNVQPTNVKLVDRARRIIEAACRVDSETAAKLLANGGSPKIAILMHELGVARDYAERQLRFAAGNLRRTLEEGRANSPSD